MKNNTVKAIVAQVPIGSFEISGLMLPDGSYAVSATQVNKCLQLATSPQNAIRSLKRLLGKDFKLRRIKSELSPNAVAILTLDEFVSVVKKSARQGNEQAFDFLEDLAGLSLYRLFATTFGKKLKDEDEQNYLKSRQQGKRSRRALTDAIKDYLDRHPECSDNKRHWIYKHVTDRLYKLTHGMVKKKLASTRGCKNEIDFRSYLSEQEIKILDSIEYLAARTIDADDIDPLEAIEQAVISIRAVGMFTN
jgi:hypothetical protein